jgi:hypothetical protein
MDVRQRQPLQERDGMPSAEGAESQASFYYGELLVAERHYRVCMQSSPTCFAFRVSELNLYADEWPEVVNVVQSVLNNSLSTRLNKRMSIKGFSGHTETTPLALMLKKMCMSTRL